MDGLCIGHKVSQSLNQRAGVFVCKRGMVDSFLSSISDCNKARGRYASEAVKGSANSDANEASFIGAHL